MTNKSEFKSEVVLWCEIKGSCDLNINARLSDIIGRLKQKVLGKEEVKMADK